MTPAQFALLYDRHYEKIRSTAAMHGIKMQPKPKHGMGPEVFAAFEEAFKRGEAG